MVNKDDKLILLLISYQLQMKNRLFEEEKGLFTFYKEQQQLQQSNQYLQIGKPNREISRPSKSKSKIKIHSYSKSPESKVLITISNNEEDEQHINKKKSALQRQKQMKYDTLASTNKNNKSTLQRTLTEPAQLQAQINSIREISRVKKSISPQHCYCSLSPTTSDLLQNYYLKNQDKIQKNSKDPQKPKMLQKFKSLQIKKRGDLISNLQNININNKLFFKQGSKHRKNAYILLKDSTKLPSIKQQVNSQSQYMQKIVVKAVKNAPYKRKELKANIQRKQLFRLNLLAQLTQQKYCSQSNQVSLINLNHIYKQQLNSSLQWQLKKKLIKSRLGIKL